VGYLFGQHWQRLVQDMKVFDIAVAVLAILAIAVVWWRRRK
jgi:membrane protein DedA with SNARE-associated domain